MDDLQAVLEVATAWRQQRPGRRNPRDIDDALVEPDWGGIRVVAALTPERVDLVLDGERVVVPDELSAALVAGFRAVAALVEGHLTTMALRTGVGAVPPAPKIEMPPLLIPRGLRKSVKDDPYIKARDREQERDAAVTRILDALEDGERHAFVATDLLWLDGTPLDDIPLLERKRQLDGTLDPSELVRITPYVKPSARPTLGTWGILGFGELHYRAANSRYLAGRENPDWAVGPPVGTSSQQPSSATPA